MNVKTSGKQFSQINTQALNNIEEIQDFFISQLGGAKEGRVLINDWRESIDKHELMAKKFLRKKGIPATQRICKINFSETWVELSDDLDVDSITSIKHLIKYVGDRFERDSKEDLCARIIDCIAMLRSSVNSKNAYSSVYHAVEFGKLSTLWKVYYIDSEKKSRNAKADRRKKWAVDFAIHLKNKYEDFSFKEICREIPSNKNSAINIDDYLIWIEEIDGKEFVVADEGNGEEKLTLGSFSSGYFSKAKI